MISPWLIYLYSICGGLNILAMLLFVVTFMCLWDSFDDCKSLSKNRLITCIIICIICALVVIFVPSKSEMIAIIASMTITPDNFPTDMHIYIQDLMKECGKL